MKASPKSSALTDSHFVDLLSRCIHCGLCLQSCPTYSVFGMEMDSPRGRIALMKAASEGRIAIDTTFQRHMSLCLGCLACQTACPSGVQYGELAEITRTAMYEARPRNILKDTIQNRLLLDTLANPGSLRTISWWARIYQKSGIQRLVRKINFLPQRIKAFETLLPVSIMSPSANQQNGTSPGRKRAAVAFFRGCVQEAFLPQVNEATIRVLRRNGFHVDIPENQTCCGAAHLHIGDRSIAEELARRNIDAFDPNHYEAIISNAGGCGAALKDYARLLRDDPNYAEKAQEFALKVMDISEFLAKHHHVRPTGRINAKVAYLDSCHLRNIQHVITQPRDLLREIPGVEFIELSQPDRCCGSAGVYNIIEVDTAEAILDGKIADVKASGVDVLAVSNTGCHLQMISGIRRAGLKVRVFHLVELLDQAYADSF